jgi:hypothetical protein
MSKKQELFCPFMNRAPQKACMGCNKWINKCTLNDDKIEKSSKFYDFDFSIVMNIVSLGFLIFIAFNIVEYITK